MSEDELKKKEARDPIPLLIQRRKDLDAARAEIKRLAPYERLVLRLYADDTLEPWHPTLAAEVQLIVEGP